MLTVSWIGVVYFFSYDSNLPKIKATLLAETDAVCQLYSPLPAKDLHPAVNDFMFSRYIKQKKDTQKEESQHSLSDISIRFNRNHLLNLPNHAW